MTGLLPDNLEGLTDVGFPLPDYAVIERLQAGWAAVRQNPALAYAAIRRYGAQFVQDQGFAFLRQRTMPVFEGWPMAEADVPGIGVTLTGANEDTSMQEVGGGLRAYIRQGDEMLSAYGTPMQASIQMAHYGGTQREANMMALVTFLLLLARREQLQNEDGLWRQALRMGDYNPNAEFKPEFAFMRMVTLTCQYENIWAISESPLVSGVDVTIQPDYGG
jgi:hypothetical protein